MDCNFYWFTGAMTHIRMDVGRILEKLAIYCLLMNYFNLITSVIKHCISNCKEKSSIDRYRTIVLFSPLPSLPLPDICPGRLAAQVWQNEYTVQPDTSKKGTKEHFNY